jgi:selT/selW/selH-like putative selenoprotein
VSLAAAIKSKTGAVAKLEPGTAGQFDVIVDGKVVFSKHKEHRFPEEAEVLAALG